MGLGHNIERIDSLLKDREIDVVNPLFFESHLPAHLCKEPPTLRTQGTPLEFGLLVAEFGEMSEMRKLRNLINNFVRICEESIMYRLELFVTNFNVDAFAKELAFVVECVNSLRADVTSDAAYHLLNYVNKHRKEMTPALLRKASSALFRTLDELLQFIPTCIRVED